MEGSSLLLEPEEAKQISLKVIPLKGWGKAFQLEESGDTKVWELKGVCTLQKQTVATCPRCRDMEGKKKLKKLAEIRLWMLLYVLLWT